MADDGDEMRPDSGFVKTINDLIVHFQEQLDWAGPNGKRQATLTISSDMAKDLVDVLKDDWRLARAVEPMAPMINPRVPDRLAALGELFRQRNAVYGDTYKNFGKIMMALFPGGIWLQTEEGWNRMALYMHVADKLSRYATSFSKGGHPDSLDDVSVYSQMLQEFDQMVRGKADADGRREEG